MDTGKGWELGPRILAAPGHPPVPKDLGGLRTPGLRGTGLLEGTVLVLKPIMLLLPPVIAVWLWESRGRRRTRAANQQVGERLTHPDLAATSHQPPLLVEDRKGLGRHGLESWRKSRIWLASCEHCRYLGREGRD